MINVVLAADGPDGGRNGIDDHFVLDEAVVTIPTAPPGVVPHLNIEIGTSLGQIQNQGIYENFFLIPVDALLVQEPIKREFFLKDGYFSSLLLY